MKVITLTLLTGTAFFTLKNLNIPESQEIEDDWAPITMPLEEAWPVEYTVVARVAKLVPTPAVVTSWDTMVNRVKSWEGFRSESYLCPAGVLTIGYGHTGHRVNGGTISEGEAEELLRVELRKTRDAVLKVVKVPLTDSQVAALTSFTYNCGCGALRKLVNKPGRLNDGNYDVISEVLPLYRKGGGKVLEGLVKRRAWEVSLWEA